MDLYGTILRRGIVTDKRLKLTSFDSSTPGSEQKLAKKFVLLSHISMMRKSGMTPARPR